MNQIFKLFSNYIKRRLPLFIGITILFIMGVIFGSLAVQTLSEPQKLDLSHYLQGIYGSVSPELLSSNRQSIAKQGMIDNIVKSSGLLWLLGLTIIGAPLILIVIFLRGFVVGFTVGFLIDEMLFKGIAIAIVSILPHNLISIPATILAGGACFSFAVASFKTLLGLTTDNIYNQFISCTFIMLVSSSLLALGTLIEVLITPILINLTKGLLI